MNEDVILICYVIFFSFDCQVRGLEGDLVFSTKYHTFWYKGREILDFCGKTQSSTIQGGGLLASHLRSQLLAFKGGSFGILKRIPCHCFLAINLVDGYIILFICVQSFCSSTTFNHLFQQVVWMKIWTCDAQRWEGGKINLALYIYMFFIT